MLVNLNFDAATFRMHADPKGDGIAQKIEKAWHSFELVLRDEAGAVVHRLKADVDGAFDLLDGDFEPVVEPHLETAAAAGSPEPVETRSEPLALDAGANHEQPLSEAPQAAHEVAPDPVTADHELSGFAKVDALAKAESEHHE